VGTVSPGASQTLSISAVVGSPAALTNTAAISHADELERDADGNTASATETPRQADLTVSKTVSDATPNVGEQITFTVTLSNESLDAATGVQVTDLLPDGLVFVNAAPSQGTYNSTSGVWTVGTVTPGVQQTLRITAMVDSSAALTNTAVISHADQLDPNTANNIASATERPQLADLPAIRIVKFVNGQDADSPTGPHVAAGSTLTFTYVVIDTGNVPLANVVVTDDKLGTITSHTGDTNGNGLLDPSEIWIYTQAATALAGQQTSTGTVTANDANNPPGTTATDDNAANYFGDAPPTITSNGGGDNATIAVAENTTAVTTVTATDPAGPSLGFSIVGGADRALFAINAATGALSFITAPNFEAPTAADQNNSYLVQVRASDGSLFDDQSITVNVTDVPEPPPADSHGFHPLTGWDFNWHVIATGDFNGDGNLDLIWDNGHGVEGGWLMANGVRAGTLQLLPFMPDWTVVASGDFNRDGSTDILWQNSDGLVAEWFMGNGVRQGTATIANMAGEHIVTFGDFNHDGVTDLIWENGSGVLSEWQMGANGQIAGTIALPSFPGWTAVATGDF